MHYRYLLLLLVWMQSLIAREANTTLDFPDNLNSAYSFEDIFGGLDQFQVPVALRTPPNEQSLYIVEKSGRVYKIEDLANPVKQLFLDIESVTESRGEAGLLSIAFHPDFQNNQTLFAYYNTQPDWIQDDRNCLQRISKFVITGESQDVNIAYQFDEEILIESFDERRNHNGGDLHFGQDGYLYISLGDEGAGNDSLNNSQRIDKDHYAGILRIDVDRLPANIEPNHHEDVIFDGEGIAKYKVPVDNPWIGATSFNGEPVDPTKVITEFWAVGLRNPWRMSFDSQGQLWIGDVGQVQREEIDLIPFGQAGMNFGWNFREGKIARPGSPSTTLTFDEPIYDYERNGNPDYNGKAVVGGVVYEGNEINELTNHYIFADYRDGNVWSLEKNGEDVNVEFLVKQLNISAFGLHPVTGEVLICDYNQGRIRKLVKSTSNEDEIPQLLSATGAFSDLTTLTPEAGVVAYEPIVTFWSDYAIKSRWFSLPELTKTFGFEESGPWNYPQGSIWVKHFDLEMERGNPDTKKRVETRFLVKTETSVYGLSYQWNEQGTEATLVPDEGSSINYTIDIDGVPTPKTWTIPSRSECLQCHTPGGGHALSFNTRQLNAEKDFLGLNQNMLTALYDHGYLDRDPGEVSGLEKLAAADDESASLEKKVKSYFDMNCAYCHMDGGTTPAEFDLRFHLSLEQMELINKTPLDHGGDDSRRLILPGDPDKSVLLSRISATQGFTRMPPIATSELDPNGMELVRNWIDDLGVSPVSSVSSDSRVAWFNFDSGATDKDGNLNLSLIGAYVDATDSKFGYGALNVDTVDQYGAIASSTLLNQGGLRSERSAAVWFKLDSIEGRQVVLEEGGGTRGYNIYVEDGTLFVGAWDRAVDVDDAETWHGTWLNLGTVTTDQWYHVAYVLDASENPTQLTSNAFKAFLNGVEVASGEGMQIYNHIEMILGKVVNGSRFHDNSTSGSAALAGTLDDLAIWNRALTSEEVATLADTTLEVVIGESGMVSVEQPDASTWFRVDLQHSFENPVVVLGPATKVGGQAIAPRVRNVTSSSFEFQIDEWDYLDGYHLEEQMSWLVVESGDHTLADGTKISAGNEEVTSSFKTVDMTPFISTPVLFSQVISTNDPIAVTTRQQDVTSDDFSISLEFEEAKTSSTTETVSWIAVSTGASQIGEAGVTPDEVNDHWSTVTFNSEQMEDMSLLANMQTTDGPDTANLRVNNLSALGFEVQAQEEQSLNQETAHTTEVVGYLILTRGLITK